MKNIKYIPAKTIITRTKKPDAWFGTDYNMNIYKYQSRYGMYYECRSPKASKLWGIFKESCEKYGILYQMKDIIHAYKSPYKVEQLNLFDMI